MYKRILVPVDGSPTSNQGLAEAIKLAHLTGARLRLVHVIDQISLTAAMGSYAVFSADTVVMLHEAGEQILAASKARASRRIAKVDTRLIDSLAAGVSDQILKQAVEWRADLIVLGTHGRRGVNRLVMGSDAEQIARHSPVPVLLVRDKSVRASIAARVAATPRAPRAKPARRRAT